MIYLSLVLVGLLAGFLGGLLGIGGGLVTVPFFLFLFYWFDFFEPTSMHTAIGTSLGVMVFTASSSVYSHFLKGGIRWDFLQSYAPAVLFGSFIGAFIADDLPGNVLKSVFALYAFYFGIRYIFFPQKGVESLKQAKPTSTLMNLIVGLINGIFSTLIGVGGAMMTIPYLTHFHIPMRNAIATSAFVGLVISIVGSLSFLYFGLDEETGENSIGYLYWQGLLIVGLTSVISAPFGARMAYTLPAATLKRGFGLFLIAVTISLLVS